MITALDLFSGYGGISYGLRDYIKPIAYCEIDNYARAILASRISEGELPFAPILADVRAIRGMPGACDIIVGGFPCQDISVAGLGAGLGGERSGLFFEIVRLTKEISPTFVFLENVPAIRTRGLRQVIGAFTEIGYDCRWTCLSASSVGAPHKRERWFLLAHTKGNGNKRAVRGLPSSDAKENRPKEQHENTTNKSPGSSEHSAVLANAAGIGSGSRTSEDCGSWKQDNFMRASWWSTEPNVGRVANGVAFRVDRIKAIGNGVVPLQVKTAFEKLAGLK